MVCLLSLGARLSPAQERWNHATPPACTSPGRGSVPQAIIFSSESGLPHRHAVGSVVSALSSAAASAASVCDSTGASPGSGRGEDLRLESVVGDGGRKKRSSSGPAGGGCPNWGSRSKTHGGSEGSSRRTTRGWATGSTSEPCAPSKLSLNMGSLPRPHIHPGTNKGHVFPLASQ